MLVHWLWLAHQPGLGEKGKLLLLRHFKTAEAVYEAEETQYAAVAELRGRARESLMDKNLSQAQEILDKCVRSGIGIVTLEDESYPARLKRIADPPIVLYYKGKLPPIDDNPVIGIAGTRNASSYGMRSTWRLCNQMGLCGAVLVSGMAAGIDTAAMEGGLASGAPLVGVLGCGVNRVYPSSNRSLYEKVRSRGCILSEYPPDSEPFRWNFPRRNRIISGLSCATVIVEAPEKSGALITATRAMEQGRRVFAVPGNIDLPSFAGSNDLLRKGAAIALEGWDVLKEYEALFPDKIHRGMEVPAPVKSPEEEEITPPSGKKTGGKGTGPDKKGIDKERSSAYIDLNTIAGVTELERRILKILQRGDTLVDQVAAEVGIPASQMLAQTTFLELKGLIRRLPGSRIGLKN